MPIVTVPGANHTTVSLSYDLDANALLARYIAGVIKTGLTGGTVQAFDNKAGFAPQWTLERGVAEVVGWLRAQGLGGEAFDSRMFIRLKQLKHGVEQGVLDAELRHGERVVLESEHWVAYVPFAARWPVEVHLAPRRDVPDLPALTDAERADLSVTYLELLRRLQTFR